MTADTSALEGRVAALEKRVDALDRRLASASASASASTSASSAAAASAWSCAAKCVTKFHCSTNGDNNVTWTNVTSVGGTAVDAFKSLDDQCDDILYVQGQCSEGSFVRTEATLANACVRN